MLTLGAYGDQADFFELKGIVETILKELRVPKVRFTPCRDNPSYHPGRCAQVWCDAIPLGVFGQLHPTVAANYNMDGELYCAELDFEALMRVQGPQAEYTPLPRFPAATRDLCVVCDEAVTVGELESCIVASGGQYLKDTALFDIYRGESIPQGKKSLAFSLTLRAEDRSLTASEADEIISDILDALKEQLGAVLR